MVLGTASVALLIAFSTSIAASGEHRNLTNQDTVLATASQEVIAELDNQPQLFAQACSNPISTYPYYSATGIPLPAPYTANYNVQYVNTLYSSTTTPLSAIQYWNGSVFQSTCENNEPQLITIGISGTSYTNSFVVQYPIASVGQDLTDPATGLIFLVQPVGGYAGSPFTQQPVVEVSNGSSAVPTDLSPVILTLTTGAGTLAGCTGNEILGVVTFSGCTVGTGGSGFQITATDGNLTAVSAPFNVTNSNFYLGFSTQPKAGPSGSPFTNPPAVTVYNTSNNLKDTAWNGTITLASSGGQFTNCPGSTNLTDKLTVTNGVATLPSTCDFSGGYFYNANSSPQVTATNYTMTATANPTAGTDAAVPALSQGFSVSSFGTASQLAFSTQPTGVASASASDAFTGQPSVVVEDAFGNVVTSAANAVGLSMYLGGASETLSNCSGSYSQGTDTFSGCNGTAYNTGLHLVATSTGLTSATSANFNITNVATQLLFTKSPVAGASGSALAVQPALVFEDAANRVVTAAPGAVTFTVSPAGTGVGLHTCTGLAPNLGYVNVANCTFTGVVGTAYTLTATAGGLTSAPSASFSPTGPGAASQLAFTLQPVAGPAGTALTTQPIVKVEDSAGNVVTSSTASINLTASGGTLSLCTGLTAAAGVVNVSNCTFGGLVGTQYTLTAASGVLTSAVSGNLSPSQAGVVTTIWLSGCPAAITVTKTCTVTATLEDAYTNVELLDNSSAVSFNELTGFAAMTGFTSNTVTGGQASIVLSAASAGSVTFNATSDSVTSGTYAITVNAVPAISTSSLATATQTQIGYSQTLASTGGTAPLTWSITAGALPTGLSLNPATGAITGTVGNTASSQTFTVTLSDADGMTATKSLTIVVNIPPSVTTASLATATQGQIGYSQTVAGTNGTAPYTWSVTTGSLPSGLGLNAASGAITGTLGVAATSQTFTVTLTDINGVTAAKSLTITVNVSPSISPNSLPSATRTGTYSQTLSVSGGTPPFGSWSVSAGTLPTGLSLNTSAGAITGTVDPAATSQTFTIQITDANGVSATKTYTLTVNAVPSIATASLATATDGQVGYSQTLAGIGGTTPYTWSILSGTLPTGLSLAPATGAITGTVSGSATSQTPTFMVTDTNGVTATKALTITVNAAPSVTTASLVVATQGEIGYAQTLTASGGTLPLTWSILSGSLPTGLNLAPATGAITGTVGGSATSQTFTVKVIDTNGVSATKSLTLTVNLAPSITTSSLPGGTKTGTYNQTLTGTNGTTPYTWSITTGTLPTGLSLNAATGAITGTVDPAATNQTFTVTLTDANGVTATKSLTITVNGLPSVTTASLNAATDGQVGYSQTLTGTGGTVPYTWSITTGMLPLGLGLNAGTGAITGTVNGAATSQTFTVTLTDADGVTATKSLTITVNAAPSVTTASLVVATQGEIGYAQTLTASGGTLPLTWSILSGSLPTGLNLAPATGAITGTVGGSATSQTFTVKVIDTNGVSATKSLTLTVNVKPSITNASLNAATDGQVGYSQTLTAAGGTLPLAWSISSGTLPTGLGLNAATGAITGTVGGSATTQTPTFMVTDTNGVTATKALTITVNAAPTITTAALPGATLTGPYNQTLAGSLGTVPYTWSITTGTLPLGLGLNAGTGAITGTVNGAATSQTFTVTLTDTNGVTATKSLTITVNPVPSVTTASLLTATDGQVGYSQTLAGTGGTLAYAWSVTTGTLPTGLGLNLGTGAITGTVNGAATSQTFTVTLTDANGVTATKSLTITVNAAPAITTGSLPGGTKLSPYNQTVVATGGTTPNVWSISSGTLPTGLSINAATGAITGTVGAGATNQTFTVKVTDTNNVAATKSFTITINAAVAITTASLPGATVTGTYNQSVIATGGTTPFAWSITSGVLPTGLSLNAGTGAITGTVNIAAVNETFTVQVVDTNGSTASQSLTIVINALPTITTTSPLPGGTKNVAYSQTLSVSGGTGPYTWSWSGTPTLPGGLTLDGATGTISGRPNSKATFTFTVTLTDADGVTTSKAFSLKIA